MRRAGLLEVLLLALVTIAVIVFALLPSMMVFLSSFNSSATLEFPPRNWTLSWYGDAFGRLLGNGAGDGTIVREALTTSLTLAVTSAAIAGLAGTAAAYALVRFRFSGKRLFEHWTSLPLIFPAVSFGVGLLLLYSEVRFGWLFGRLLLAHTILVLPFVVRNIMASLAGIGPNLEDAALVLGAPRWRAFSSVVLPLIKPGLVAAVVLAFIISFNEFTVSYFLYRPEVRPFSVWVFQQTEAAFDTSLTAIASIVLGFNLLLIWLLQSLSRGRDIGM